MLDGCKIGVLLVSVERQHGAGEGDNKLRVEGVIIKLVDHLPTLTADRVVPFRWQWHLGRLVTNLVHQHPSREHLQVT